MSAPLKNPTERPKKIQTGKKVDVTITVLLLLDHPSKLPELRSYRVVTAVINWQQKRGLALWMFCRVDTEPGTMLQ